MATALCSSLGSLGQIVNGKKPLEISGTVYIRPLIGVHCMYSYPYISSGFLHLLFAPNYQVSCKGQYLTDAIPSTDS